MVISPLLVSKSYVQSYVFDMKHEHDDVVKTKLVNSSLAGRLFHATSAVR